MWPFTRKSDCATCGDDYTSSYRLAPLTPDEGFAMIIAIVSECAERQTPPPPRPSVVTSGFFYDPDLAKFGNAVSPFVEMSSRDAHMAEQRRFEDRYDPRYFQDDGDMYVGWAQPPHPIDVVPSFDPLASGRDQARAVLMDYYHDDPLRYWADNEAVKHCFGVKTKEDYDPALLVDAYENKNHKVWACKGDKNTWKDMDEAVRAAIAHRTKLGPLPTSSYDSDPIVIYYYDNDRMKRISYPRASIPAALNPSNQWWWKWGQGPGDDASKKKGLDDVHTSESNDPKAIAAERSAPGYPGGGNWGSEGVTWDKDMIGVVGPLIGALLAIVSAVLDMTGVGAVIGVPLGIATPFIVAAINATDTALHAGDFGAALQNLGPALVSAASAAISKGTGTQIPAEATKALGATVTAIGNAVASASKKNIDFGELWDKVNKKASTFGKITDSDAHTIAVMLGENAAGNVFIHGYQAGKLTDAKTVAAIAKIMDAMKQFSDPRIINIFLLGAGMGTLAREQAKVGVKAPAHKTKKHAAHKTVHHAHVATQGDFVGSPELQLEAFVTEHLAPRYGLDQGDLVYVSGPPSDPLVVAIQTLLNEMWGFVHGQWGYIPITGVLTARTKELIASFQQSYNVAPGDGTPNAETVKALEAAVDDKRSLQQHALHATSGGMIAMDANGICHSVGAEPEPDWSALSRGCPKGTWWDSLTGQCRPPPPPPPRTSGGFIPDPEAVAWCQANGTNIMGDDGSMYDGIDHDYDVAVGAPTAPEMVRWYAGRTEGAVRDLVDALATAPHVHVSGEYPIWTLSTGTALFKLVHDAEGGVRVHLLNVAPSHSLDEVWRDMDQLIRRS